MDRYIIRTVKGSEGKRIENGGHDGGSTNLKPLGNADDTEVAQKTNVTVQGNEYNISNNKTKALNKELLSESDDPSHNIPINRLERENRIKRGPYQPKMASFPRSKKGTKCRSFQNNWYDTYGWLEYSKSLDAVFCFFCRFFGSNDSAHKGHIDSAFIRKGFDKWHKAHEGFKKHETSVGHLQSISSWTNYKTGKSVDVLLDENKQAQISKQEQIRLQNRQVFDRFINIVLCLVKAGKPLRGHNENTSSYEKGLFLDIVDLISKYDPVLKQHIESGPANAKYLSSKIQNDIILSLHNVILRKIASSLENKKISIISDDTSDVGHHEQMSVVVRHYDEKRNMPAEHFVALQRLISVDALSIFNELHSVISKLGIKWSNVVSVCFDGASTMSGCTAGVQAKCKEKNSNILYVHCYAHCLNLVLVDACTSSKQNRVLFDFFGVIQYLYTFIEGSCTRHAVLEKIAASVDVTLKSLKSLSTTRWACRAEAVAAVKNNYIAIILALEEIVDTTRHADVKAKGRGLLYQIKTFEFIFALNIMHPFYSLY